jgi:hypothetical protein
LKEELLEEKQADTFMALPWGIYSSITHVKEDGVLLIKLFGTQATGNDWRLINAEEMKEKWGFEALNLDENKSAPYFGIDNISGSRKFHHKGVWKFLVRVGKEIPNGEHGSIKFTYSPSFGDVIFISTSNPYNFSLYTFDLYIIPFCVATLFSSACMLGSFSEFSSINKL